MKIRVLLFGVLTDAAPAELSDFEVTDGATVADVAARLGDAYPALRPHLPRAAGAVNQRFVDLGTRVAPGDEVALLPPVSGG